MRVRKVATVLLIVLQACASALAAGPASETAIRNAWALYTQQKFAPSADAFEALIRTSAPDARLYYYSAAANKAAGRAARARQLCQYITANFSTSPEAGYVQKLFPDAAGKSAASAPVGLPAHLKGKSVDELMQTEEGRQALTNAMVQSEGGTVTKKTSTTKTTTTSTTTTSTSKSARPADAVFTADIIAMEGADGITQFVGYPDAGFECSLAAMALLSRGREILADMIRCPSRQDIYLVRFPNSATEYQITPAKVETYRMKDKALWATLIHAAVRESSARNLEDGLSLLTGNRAEKILANSTTEQALTAFIGDAVRKHHPIVCLSSDDEVTPPLVEPFHGYTITGFDPTSGMVTFRNPKGGNSQRFRLEEDKQHKKFEQMNDGVFKMHISLIPRYFKEMARSAI
ncbi:MAG: hypothetical protein C0469_12905 [Cyanobacteria bacterium DS2.3.42]|nr:hypothetical protein [Cyanobacteria bacterium DS2.3.42]